MIMVNIVITVTFLVLVVGVWLLRNDLRDYNKEENTTAGDSHATCPYSGELQPAFDDAFLPKEMIHYMDTAAPEPDTTVPDATVPQHTYPDSDIETQTIEIPELPKQDTEQNADTVSLTDTDVLADTNVPVNTDISADAEYPDVVWTGDVLDDEKNARTVILADEMTPGDAYVYYRNNMNGETFKGILIADKRLDDDHKNGIVRARYARQAVNGEYKRGFIMRSSEAGSLKFYAATAPEITGFIAGCPETKEDLAYILGPYKDKYV